MTESNKSNDDENNSIHRVDSKSSVASLPSPSKSPSTESTDSLTSLDDSPLLLPVEKASILDLLDYSTSLTTHIPKKLSSKMRRGVDEFKDKAIRSRDRLRRDTDIDNLKQQLTKQVTRLEKKLTQQEVITKTEKLTFSVSAINILYCGIMIGAWPQYFHVLYSCELAVLLPLRIYAYRRRQFQYFLADLCYFVNILAIIYIWVFPWSVRLYMSCHALCFGTLCWAVITWRNSLVLHSLEKTTSTFIHVLPPVVFHVIAHRLDPEFKAKRFPAAIKLQKWDFINGLLSASTAYFVWQIAYHYFITIRKKEQIKAGRVTSFEFLRKAYANNWIGKFVNGLPGPFPVVAFTFIQYGYQVCTMLLVPIWYSNELLSSIFLTFIFGMAAYNGGSYYVEVFGKRFQKELIQLEKNIANFEMDNNVQIPQTLRSPSDKQHGHKPKAHSVSETSAKSTAVSK